MMKRIALCALALLTLLCSCGGGPAGAPYTPDDAQALLDAELFNGDMGEVDSYIVSMLYGIDEGSITGCVSYQAANTAESADELTVLTLSDEQAAQTAEAACRQRVADQIEASRDYTPAAIPRLEAAVIRRSGNTVLLAVGDPDRLEAAVDALHQ